MASNSQRILRLVDQQSAQRASILNRLIVFIQRLAGRTDWYNEDQVRAFASQAADLSRSAQTATGSLTAAYLTRTLAEMGVDVQQAPIVLPQDLRGVPQETVWERPAKEYRYLRSTGVDESDALQRLERRAHLIADDDVTLAMRTASCAVLAPLLQVTGYRRVIHPELSKGGTCGLCIAASDRVYSTDQLQPVHENCHCEPLPIVAGDDPGNSLNGVSLADLYRHAGDNTAKKLKQTRYQVNEHGELGPVLRAAGQEFRDQATASRDTRN